MELTTIQNRIYEIRGQRVMLDFDLAALYGVETKALNQAVKRNIKRFEGDDFMFQLTKDESMTIDYSRSQIVTLNSKRGSNIKYMPHAFTELGVAIATQQLPDNNDELRKEIQALRNEMNEILADQNDINESTRAQLDAISLALAELQANPPQRMRRPIGFIQHTENK